MMMMMMSSMMSTSEEFDCAAAINPTDGDETGVYRFTAGSTCGDSWSKVNETSDGRGAR